MTLLGLALVLIFLLGRAPVASRAYRNPVAIILGVLITVAGIAAVIMIRRRRLSPTVRTFYDYESRRRRFQTIGYGGLYYLGWIAIALLAWVATCRCSPRSFSSS